MSELDECITMVALTYRQLRWIQRTVGELARQTYESDCGGYGGMLLGEMDELVEQMRVAAYALEEEKGGPGDE